MFSHIHSSGQRGQKLKRISKLNMKLNRGKKRKRRGDQCMKKESLCSLSEEINSNRPKDFRLLL